MGLVSGWQIYFLLHLSIPMHLVSVLFGSLIPTFCSIFAIVFYLYNIFKLQGSIYRMTTQSMNQTFAVQKNQNIHKKYDSLCNKNRIYIHVHVHHVCKSNLSTKSLNKSLQAKLQMFTSGGILYCLRYCSTS